MRIFTGFGKAMLAIGFSAVAVAASAQTEAIKGYFRVQSAAGVASNSNYVEVRGPFTAHPDRTFDQARNSAGTILYVEAVPEGAGANVAYRLTHLRGQGIDVALDDVAPEDYESFIQEAIATGASPVYALVQQGFAKGYTSVARATVGFVFTAVATRLEKYHVNDDFTDNDFINVTSDFNKNVTANLDLGIRLRPVPEQERTYQMTFDVPSFKIVSDWYIGDGSEAQNKRKAVFEAAMDAMTAYLKQSGANMEIFSPKDQDVLKTWGYDLQERHPEHGVVAEGQYAGYVQSNFRTIFADHDLLFNWIKLFAYKVAHPEEFPDDLAFAGEDLAQLSAKLREHYLTSLMLDYLPRISQNSRAHLINGRVYNSAGNVGSAGSIWDAAGNTFGFASREEVKIAGDNANWVLQPVDNDTQDFHVSLTTQHKESNMYYGARVYDFAVQPANPADTRCYTLTDMQVKQVTETPAKHLTYVELVEITETTIPAGTPFMVESSVSDPKFIIPNTVVYPDPIDKRPDNSLIVSDKEVTVQHVAAPRSINVSENFKGVMLPTSVNPDALYNLWGITYGDNNPLHLLDNVKQANKDRIGFVAANSGTIPANVAFYLPEENKTDNLVLIGEPEEEIGTGIDTVVTDTMEADVVYDLRGVRVAEPRAGQIYIINGKKVLAL